MWGAGRVIIPSLLHRIFSSNFHVLDGLPHWTPPQAFLARAAARLGPSGPTWAPLTSGLWEIGPLRGDHDPCFPVDDSRLTSTVSTLQLQSLLVTDDVSQDLTSLKTSVRAAGCDQDDDPSTSEWTCTEVTRPEAMS